MAEARASIKAEVVEGVALITFSAPPQNVATAETWTMLAEQMQDYAEAAEVRAVVLTGAGHHAFVSDPAPSDTAEAAEYEEAAERALAAMAVFPKPVLVRVRGACIGTGLLVALHADIAVAAADSTFALPAARWGQSYSPNSIAALVRLVGPQQAKRLLFSGARLEAREAAQIGLVTLAVDDTALTDTVVDLARTVAESGPLAVAAAKRMVASPGDPALPGLVEQCRNSKDYAAGVAALGRGKPPAFEGR